MVESVTEEGDNVHQGFGKPNMTAWMWSVLNMLIWGKLGSWLHTVKYLTCGI